MAKDPDVRIAFRMKGDWWVAYMAQPDTMDGAIELGRILARLPASNQTIRQAFMRCMQDVFAEVVVETLGLRPDGWHERPAPEHERAGRSDG